MHIARKFFGNIAGACNSLKCCNKLIVIRSHHPPATLSGNFMHQDTIDALD